MADFPLNPIPGTTFTAPDGTVWTWDGYSWTATGGGGGGSMSNVVISANSTATLNANGINFVNTATIGVNVNPGSTGNANVTMTLLGGVQGVQGTIGIQGLTGIQGIQGAQGTQGVQGTTGTQGAVGTQGAIGAQGTQGVIGSQGTIGIQGLDGLYAGQGATGAQGSIGAQGAAADGSLYVAKAGDTMTGSLNVANEVRIQGAYPFVTYYQTDGAANQKYSIQLTDGNAWEFRLYSDSLSEYSSALIITRDGWLPSSITMNANVGIATSSAVEPNLTFYRPSKIQGVGIGLLNWSGLNASDSTVQYARLQTEISSNTAGAHTGNFQIETYEGGTLAPRLEVNGANVNIINGFGAALRIKNPYARAEVNSTGSGNNSGLKLTATYDGTNFNYSGIYLEPSSTLPYVGISADDANYQFTVDTTGGTRITKLAQTTYGTQHLELYSPDTGVSTNSISLRFHEANRYYSAIRCNAAGFTFTSGDSYVPTAIQAGNTRLHGGQVWSETTPGTSVGTLHLNPNSTTDHYGCAITFGASDNLDGVYAQAGIYTRTDGSYGSKMYFATSDNYGTGSKNRMSINHQGNVGIGSAATVTAPGSIFHVEDGAWSRFHLGYQGSVNYMDGDTQNFRKYAGYQQLSLYSNTSIQHAGGLFNLDGYSGTNIIRVLNPKGGARGSQSVSETGYIKIKLPKYSSDTMMSFTVVIYDYAGGAENAIRTIRVSGYNYASGAWANYGASEINGNGTSTPLEVRFGHDGVNNIVWIGSSGTGWAYPQVAIMDYIGGYYGVDSGWASGFDISITASLNTVTAGPIYTNKAIVTNYQNSATMEPNTGTYAAWRINGSLGGYGGMEDAFSGVSWMFDSAGNGGFYRTASSRWYGYYSLTNDCWGFAGTTTSSTYAIYASKGIYSTGDIVAYSDARVKENVYTIDNALDKVCRLRGVYYNRIDDETKARKVGVIAQEVNEVLPEVVTHADSADAEGNTKDEYGVDYGKMVGLLIEAVKELNAKVDAQAELIRKLTNG